MRSGLQHPIRSRHAANLTGTGPHPLPPTQREGTLWVGGRGCGPVPTVNAQQEE